MHTTIREDRPKHDGRRIGRVWAAYDRGDQADLVCRRYLLRQQVTPDARTGGGRDTQRDGERWRIVLITLRQIKRSVPFGSLSPIPYLYLARIPPS